MAIGSNLLRQHFETLVAYNNQWQSLIDDVLWELVYAPSQHPARLSGRDEVGECVLQSQTQDDGERAGSGDQSADRHIEDTGEERQDGTEIDHADNDILHQAALM